MGDAYVKRVIRDQDRLELTFIPHSGSRFISQTAHCCVRFRSFLSCNIRIMSVTGSETVLSVHSPSISLSKFNSMFSNDNAKDTNLEYRSSNLLSSPCCL